MIRIKQDGKARRGLDLSELAAEKRRGQRRRKRWQRVTSAISALVVFVTAYALILPALTQEVTAHCGLEDHVHTDACYETRLVCGLEEYDPEAEPDRETAGPVLICGLEEHVHGPECYGEDGELMCTVPEHTHGEECFEPAVEETRVPHVHTEECYEQVLICGLEEHEHSRQCYSDPDADTDPSEWDARAERALAALGDGADAAGRLVAVARSQLDYSESRENYLVQDDGENGYTIYGASCGYPYGDWCAMFLDWCMSRAGARTVPVRYGCGQWADRIRSETFLWKTDTPAPGDLIFFDWDGDGDEDHVGLVTGTSLSGSGKTTVTTVEGNSSDSVRSNTYTLDDPAIAGFATVPSQGVTVQYLADGSTLYTAVQPDLLVRVTAAPGALPPGTAMTAAEVDASDVADTVRPEAVVRAVDISFRDAGGSEIEPASPVQVQMISSAIRQAKNEGRELSVVHLADDGAPETIDSGSGQTEPEVIFTADSFSTYVVVGSVIEETVLASDGHNYRVTVTYGPEACVPDGAKLSVEEITESSEVFDEYVARAESALGWEDGSAVYVRLFDIGIVDANGDKVEIAAPVDVTLELADRTSGETAETQVVHFADGAQEGDVISGVETDGHAVSFRADGFSAYAIVTGPSAVPLGWNRLQTLDELIAEAARGLYIGHPNGYYLTNGITNISSTRTGITKTKPAQSCPGGAAALYYFEIVAGTDDQFYVYCYNGTEKQYVKNEGNNSLSFTDDAGKTAFTATASGGIFTLSAGQWYWNMQGGAGGASFAAYNKDGDSNNRLNLWYYVEPESDPYSLNGLSYGLMSWNGGTAGKAMMAEAESAGSLTALPLTVMSKADNNADKLFVPNDSDITLWTFEWIDGDRYRLSAETSGGTKYLRVDADGVSLADEPDEACAIQVVPGTGAHAGELCLMAGNVALTYSGSAENGFNVGGPVGGEWLHLVDLSELTSDYCMTYSASKVSIADPSVTNGSRIILFTRSWNEAKKRYEFYAVDYDGTLVPCYESGDSIQWVGKRLNTLLWNFVEYYYDGTNTPNYYYELYNPYSSSYIAPQLTGDQVLSSETIGINLNGRRNEVYYSEILAWDPVEYAYAGLKVEDGRIVTCPREEADDFYFAVMQDIPVDDTLTLVPTVEHTQFGITMKMVDFGTRAELSEYLGNDEGGMVNITQPGLLSDSLGADGYPTAAGGSLGSLFSGAREVDHLFIRSIYNNSGYFEFDSTQNFASLDGSNFKVYKELGSYDSGGNKNTLKHGQFFPYNDLVPGLFTSVNTKNLYSSTAQELPDSDPRKFEQLYLVRDANCFFGMELEASFVQTPNGLDDWGHDIIYEFTGDDDFWLYVDGELVIDLGGIHSALAGSVNFRTGDVYVNGSHTTLRRIFEDHYRANNPDANDAAVTEYLDGIFKEGTSVFTDYSSHTMRIFYLERGAGASNLHMRFNLASVKPGTVQLSKQLAGVDESESVLAEFPYQIWYTTEENGTPQLLEQGDLLNTKAFYRDSTKPVKYEPQFTVDGTVYHNVFFLRSGETAEINFPDDTAAYSIVECGVNTSVYRSVSVNGEAVAGSPVAGHPDRSDFAIGYAEIKDRARVDFLNEVDRSALRTLTITKLLFREDGSTPIHYAEDSSTFGFRLSFSTEFDPSLPLANMHTYHVRDADGNYCRWDSANQRFQSIGETDYSLLSAEQKAAVSFTTSMNGSISNIPADYTVEVREVLAGTQFGVQERDYEIPDGYSLQKYVLNGTDSETPPHGTVVAGQDPHVDVRNLKGWGLRVNKSWSDADYMISRDPAYFAVFTDDGSGNLTLVDGSVRQLTQNETTLYWYFRTLPDESVPFDRYEIREVTLTEPVIDGDGNVTSYGSLTAIGQGGELKINGQQNGESSSSQYSYTVQYHKGTVEADSNVRVDEVVNSRPGIRLEKQDWNGNPLANATFTLEGGGGIIGPFTSDSDGLVTVAFLQEGEPYTLTETSSPQGYHGLEAPMTLLLENGSVTISNADPAYYELIEEEGTTPVLIVRNKPFTLRVIKVDGNTDSPLAGAEFALHAQVTVDGVTAIDDQPVSGCGSLVSEADGTIPMLDNTLLPRTYELRELSAPDGYQAAGSALRFTLSPTGAISLGQHPDGVTLTETVHDEDGAIEYVLSIPNSRLRKLSFKKVDIAATDTSALEGAVFDLYRVKDGVQANAPLLGGLVSDADGMLTLNGETVFELAVGVYHLVETDAPAGYNIRSEPVVVTITATDGRTGVTYDDGTALSHDGGLYFDEARELYSLKISNSSGVSLPSTGGRGAAPYRLAGALLAASAGGFLLINKKRRKA